MLHINRTSLLALLLTTTLVFVQTALPWLHAGCEHDHAGLAVTSQTAKSAHQHSAHQHYGHHHHGECAEEESTSSPAFDHRHDRELVHDCAACRYLQLSSVVVESTEVVFSEQISLIPAPVADAAPCCEPVGRYRSRAPPSLS